MDTVLILSISGLLFYIAYRYQREPTSEASDSRSIRRPDRLHFDLNNPEDIASIQRIKKAFADTLQDESSVYADCMYRPTAELPYSKPVIRGALTSLLDYVEGRRDSVLLDDGIRTAEAAKTIDSTLNLLEDFLEVSPERLPEDPKENLRAGASLRNA